MQTHQLQHGIVNGHWEPAVKQPSKLLELVRSGIAKLADKASGEQHEELHAEEPESQRRPVAAE